MGVKDSFLRERRESISEPDTQGYDGDGRFQLPRERGDLQTSRTPAYRLDCFGSVTAGVSRLCIILNLILADHRRNTLYPHEVYTP